MKLSPYSSKQIDGFLAYLLRHFGCKTDDYFHLVNIENYDPKVCNWWYRVDISWRTQILKELEHEGLIQHYYILARNIGYQLTEKGTHFVNSGGYTKRKLHLKRKRLKSYLRYLVLALIAGGGGYLISVWLI